MSDDTRMQLLRSIELFLGLSEEELTLLAKHAAERYFDQGALLFEQSSPLTDLFIIVQGEVELFSIGSFGEHDRLGYFSDGDFLGEGSWASHQPNATSARV